MSSCFLLHLLSQFPRHTLICIFSLCIQLMSHKQDWCCLDFKHSITAGNHTCADVFIKTVQYVTVTLYILVTISPVTLYVFVPPANMVTNKVRIMKQSCLQTTHSNGIPKGISVWMNRLSEWYSESLITFHIPSSFTTDSCC